MQDTGTLVFIGFNTTHEWKPVEVDHHGHIYEKVSISAGILEHLGVLQVGACLDHTALVRTRVLLYFNKQG